jgi:hypothetical protein
VRSPQRLRKDTAKRSAIPTVSAERMMVFLWLRREETKPDPISVKKYPKEIRKKRKPASPWLTRRSPSMVGNKGARIILETKFRQKMPAKRRRGPTWARREEEGFSSPVLL